MPAVAAPFLLSGLQPHRGGLLQGQEPHQEGEGEDPPSAVRGHRGGSRSGQRGGRPKLLQGLRLRDALGPTFMKTALGNTPAELSWHTHWPEPREEVPAFRLPRGRAPNWGPPRLAIACLPCSSPGYVKNS